MHLQHKKRYLGNKTWSSYKMGKKNNFITSIAMPPLNRLYRRRSTMHRKENRYASVHKSDIR